MQEGRSRRSAPCTALTLVCHAGWGRWKGKWVDRVEFSVAGAFGLARGEARLDDRAFGGVEFYRDLAQRKRGRFTRS